MASSQLTLVSVLERAGTVYPRAEIVSQRSDGTTLRYTYADFYRRARALAAALQECGLHHCDRVATLMSNHHIQLEASFGVPVAGGMLHALNPHLPADALAHIINHAQDRFLIVDDVLATGGTAKATIDLARKAGGKIIGVAFLIELDFLNGRSKLAGEPVYSVLRY